MPGVELIEGGFHAVSASGAALAVLTAVLAAVLEGRDAVVMSNEWSASSATLEVNGRALRVGRAYADVDVGEPAALVGSTGLIEVAVREGSAAQAFGLRRGSPVVLRPR